MKLYILIIKYSSKYTCVRSAWVSHTSYKWYEDKYISILRWTQTIALINVFRRHWNSHYSFVEVDCILWNYFWHVCFNVQNIWFCPLVILLWACLKVLVIVVIVCKCLLISSICFFSPISPFMHAVPPVSLLLPPPHLLSSCAQTLRPALKPQLTVGTSPSFLCQHSMAFSACQLSTVRHVTETCTGMLEWN